VDFVRGEFVSKHLFKPYNAYFRAQRHELNNTRRTDKRAELVAEFGYDIKFASHAARLGYQCIELMTSGTLCPTLQGNERDICFGIKTGKFSLSSTNDILEGLDKKMYQAYKESPLKSSPDFSKVNDFITQKYYNYIKGELEPI
jgi:hypothetical protein